MVKISAPPLTNSLARSIQSLVANWAVLLVSWNNNRVLLFLSFWVMVLNVSELTQSSPAQSFPATIRSSAITCSLVKPSSGRSGETKALSAIEK